jgi:hypothetical protein
MKIKLEFRILSFSFCVQIGFREAMRIAQVACGKIALRFGIPGKGGTKGMLWNNN